MSRCLTFWTLGLRRFRPQVTGAPALPASRHRPRPQPKTPVSCLALPPTGGALVLLGIGSRLWSSVPARTQRCSGEVEHDCHGSCWPAR
jgi:hypothetical protein